jgi:SAM-dependent methyltransferase
MPSGDRGSAEPGLARLGTSLRDAGLTTRALAAWAGTARIAALPARLPAIPAPPRTPAAAILALFVAGAELAQRHLQLPRGRSGTGAPLDELVDHQLLERNGDQLRARVAILPLGRALLVCDRLDAPIERDLVCWPDDSSYHLATAILPGRRGRWLDLGCGSAFAPLARPDLAAQISGIDINERAVRHARLGAALSGIAHLDAVPGDASAAHEPAELVTCNTPIPDAPDRPPLSPTAVPEVWRRADPGLFDRLWPALRRAVRPGGMIVVHGASDAVVPALASADGERVVVTYTPDTVRGFAIAWWRPDAPARFVAARRALTPDRPHVDPADRDAALAL